MTPSSSRRKPLLGLSDFKQVIEGNYYYVDKSLFVKEVLDYPAQVLLLPRPRRFGKTLNLSLLRYFFEKNDRLSNTATTSLFTNLNIWKAGKTYQEHQGQYPVIFLSFKDLKTKHWPDCLDALKALIAEEYQRHEYIEKHLSTTDQQYFNQVLKGTGSSPVFWQSLRRLSLFLESYHHRRVIILIDEYDVPIQSGYLNGYYDEVVEFMRNFLSAGLKDNPSLEKGVLTGILRVAKESIFSGLNNLDVSSLLSTAFNDKFGLTEEEVEQVLEDFDLKDRYEEVREWYNGYVFGDRVIYNPWSIMSFVSKPADGCKPYWVNTSDNAVVEQLITRGGRELREELESLLRGESIEKPVDEHVVFGEIERRDDLVWSFLLFSGYLKYTRKWFDATYPGILMTELAIPNQEVQGIFFQLVHNWFRDRVEDARLRRLLDALRRGRIEEFGQLFREVVARIFSYHDFGEEAEKVYQAFTIGLLVWLRGTHEVKNNRESGYGRYDVMLIPKDVQGIGYVIEFKKVDTAGGESPEQALEKALQQIDEKGYTTELHQRGIRRIKKLAVAFRGKEVWVKEGG